MNQMMTRPAAVAVLALLLLGGCVTVPTHPDEVANASKRFDDPPPGKAGLYIYREGTFGGALKKSIWVDGKCVGQSAPNVFFHVTVEGDREHTVSTASEFSPNDLTVKTAAGENYFIRQYIKLGLLIHGANLEVVGEDRGRRDIAPLKMAKRGRCNK